MPFLFKDHVPTQIALTGVAYTTALSQANSRRVTVGSWDCVGAVDEEPLRKHLLAVANNEFSFFIMILKGARKLRWTSCVFLVFHLGCFGDSDNRDAVKETISLRYHALVGDESAFDSLFVLAEEIPVSTGKDHLIGDFISFDVTDTSILIADIAATRLLLLFHSNGSFIRQIGRQGSGPGEYLSPRVIAFDPRGGILAYDTKLLRMDRYDRDGRHVMSVVLGKFFDRVAVDSRHNIVFQTATWVSVNSNNATVYTYDTLGRNTAKCAPQSENFVSGGGSWGGGIALDGAGNIFEMTPYEYRVRVYDIFGSHVRTMIEPPSHYVPLQKPSNNPQTSMESLRDYHRSWSHITNLLLYDGDILLIITQVWKDGERLSLLDIHDTAGNTYKTGVRLPFLVGPYNAITKGHFLYLVNPSIEAEGIVFNPTIKKYRLRTR